MKTYNADVGIDRKQEISCPVCGSVRRKVKWKMEGADFRKCSECGLIYQNPQPVFDDLEKRYQDNYFKYELENDANFFGLMRKGLEDIDFYTIESQTDDKSFLDIGCATGMLLAFVKDRGWNVQGVELCESSARYGIEKRGVPIHIGTLEEAPLKEKSFSFIHFSHLIEHVGDPRRFLETVNALLNDQGHMVLVTPNSAGFQARLLGAKWRSAIPDHLHLFNKRTMRKLLNETGFRILREQTWGGIAEGLAPKGLKRVLDKSAKKYGFGDVMLFLCGKTGTADG
ncbi:MAG: methyltransferase domain-containing protein [Spirochaetia bacterium]